MRINGESFTHTFMNKCTNLHALNFHVYYFIFTWKNVSLFTQLSLPIHQKITKIPRNGPLGQVQNEQIFPGFLKQKKLDEIE